MIKGTFLANWKSFNIGEEIDEVSYDQLNTVTINGYSYFNWVYFYVHTEDVTLSGFNPTVKIIAKKDNVCVFQYKYNTILKDIFVGDKRVYEVIANNQLNYYYGGFYKSSSPQFYDNTYLTSTYLTTSNPTIQNIIPLSVCAYYTGWSDSNPPVALSIQKDDLTFTLTVEPEVRTTGSIVYINVHFQGASHDFQFFTSTFNSSDDTRWYLLFYRYGEYLGFNLVDYSGNSKALYTTSTIDNRYIQYDRTHPDSAVIAKVSMDNTFTVTRSSSGILQTYVITKKASPTYQITEGNSINNGTTVFSTSFDSVSSKEVEGTNYNYYSGNYQDLGNGRFEIQYAVPSSSLTRSRGAVDPITGERPYIYTANANTYYYTIIYN